MDKSNGSHGRRGGGRGILCARLFTLERQDHFSKYHDCVAARLNAGTKKETGREGGFVCDGWRWVCRRSPKKRKMGGGGGGGVIGQIACVL